MSTTQQPDRVAIPVCGRELEGTVVDGEYEPRYYQPTDDLVVDIGAATLTVDAADAVPIRTEFEDAEPA